MRNARFILMSCVALSGVSIAHRGALGQELPAPSEVVLVQRCEISYDRATIIGSFTLHGSSTARMHECFVKMGDRVKSGQLLGRLYRDDVTAELEAKVAELKRNEVAIVQKQVLLELERAKMERLRRINQRQALLVSAQDVQVQEIAVEIAKLEIAAATEAKNVSQGEVKQLKAIVSCRDLVAPHDGIVVDIFAPVGEVVFAAKPIFRVVDTDVLRVTGYIDGRDAWRVKQGHAVRILPEVSGADVPLEKIVFPGAITFVDSEIDTEKQICRVIAQVENRNLMLRAGLECRMEIDLRDRPKEQKPARATPAAESVRQTPRTSQVTRSPKAALNQ